MKRPFPLAAALLLGVQASYASENTANLEAIDVVVVTPARIEQPEKETTADVSVISREDVERSQARSVPELLERTPGLGVTNNGGPGKATSIHLRGTNADHTLIMIDGVKIGSATTGTASLQDLPVELIDHIEILRGPASSLYGSEAIGGVIQIFTRKGGPARTTFSVGGGTYGTVNSSASVSGSAGKDVWYGAGLSGFHTDGFNACKGRPSKAGGGGCWTYEPDRDGYENLSGNARAGWRFASWGEAEVNAMRTVGENEFDGTSVNRSEIEQQLLSGTLTLTPLEYWKTTLKAAQTWDYSDNFYDDLFKSRFNTRRDLLSWQSELTAGASQRLIAGVDWQNDHVDSATPYDVASRANTGVFTQYLTSLGAHNIQLGLRRDENEQFGGHVTGNIGWGYKFDNGLRLTASYGTAFKAPTFNELYYPNFGNPDLLPEQSESGEIGVSGQIEGVHWAVKAYETQVKDLIGFDATFVPANIDSARIRGIETTLSGRLSGWDWRAALSLIDPENMSDGANRGNVLTRRARESWSFSLDRAFGDWRLGGTARGEGLRYDDLANTIELAPYVVADLRAEYRLDDDWRVQFKLENLFDQDYETAFLFRQPGRSAFVTLRYQH
jgi:vitamin B12 transporter